MMMIASPIKIIDLIIGFRSKTFKMDIDRYIKFVEYQIFINVTYFIDILKEYEVKNRYHLKKIH